MRLYDTKNNFKVLNEGEKYPESSPFMSSTAAPTGSSPLNERINCELGNKQPTNE